MTTVALNASLVAMRPISPFSVKIASSVGAWTSLVSMSR